MPASLDGKLVVAISSRALFNFEDENQVFDDRNDVPYMKLQLERLDMPAELGVAFPLIKKLLAFNTEALQRVEVAILSRNDPVSGLRVLASSKHHGLALERAIFTRGAPPHRYLKPLNANLFLSANGEDVREALNHEFPAAQVYPLLDAPDKRTTPSTFETFPHAISCALLGQDVASAKIKGRQRRALLAALGLDAMLLKSIDALDAALCAVTAQSFLSRTFKTYGDVEGGFLIVPAAANRIILP